MTRISIAIESKLGTEADRFLKAISPSNPTGKLGSSAMTYKPGLIWFQDFLSNETEQETFPSVRSIHDFLNAVREDSRSSKESLDKTFPDRNLLKEFSGFLIKKGKSAKTVRTYVGAIQSLGAYWEIPISSQYSDLPPAIEQNEKYPWSIEKVGDFIKSMKNPFYECLGVWYVQSGLSNYDLLGLSYGKIKEQFESGTSPICLNLVRYKTRRFEIKFRTFIGELGIEYFKTYLSGRKPFADDAKIFSITDNAVEGFFARKAQRFLPEGFTQRNPCCPSSLRTGFRTFLLDVECPESIIEYFMGHNLSGDLKKKYTNKSDDSWRETYRKYESSLTFKR